MASLFQINIKKMLRRHQFLYNSDQSFEIQNFQTIFIKQDVLFVSTNRHFISVPRSNNSLAFSARWLENGKIRPLVEFYKGKQMSHYNINPEDFTPSPIKQRNPLKEKSSLVKFRCTKQEKQEIHQKAEQMGLNVSEYLRQLALNHHPVMDQEFKRGLIGRLNKSKVDFARISNIIKARGRDEDLAREVRQAILDTKDILAQLKG